MLARPERARLCASMGFRRGKGGTTDMKKCMDADNLHRRLAKILGQVQAIDRMIDEEIPCEARSTVPSNLAFTNSHSQTITTDHPLASN